MNTILTMLGSNLLPERNMKLAIEKLSAYFNIIGKSSVLISKPFGDHYKDDYHNQAIKFVTKNDKLETIEVFKQIEKELGRNAESKIKGEICIDIDLIFWNGTLMHKDYNRFYFVKQCIDEIR